MGESVTFVPFLSEEHRKQALEATTFVCLYCEYNVRFDPTDGTFWAFEASQKSKLELREVRKMPEIKLFKIDLKKYKKV